MFRDNDKKIAIKFVAALSSAEKDVGVTYGLPYLAL